MEPIRRHPITVLIEHHVNLCGVEMRFADSTRDRTFVGVTFDGLPMELLDCPAVTQAYGDLCKSFKPSKNLKVGRAVILMDPEYSITIHRISKTVFKVCFHEGASQC